MRIHETRDVKVVAQLNTSRMNPYMVGRVVDVTEDTVVFSDAYNLLFNDDGSKFDLFPFNPLGPEEELELPRSLIISLVEADDQIKRAHTKKTSGITIAGANEVPNS